MKYRNKEISWLSFNGRVLQEAGDRSVPLMERMKFLGIFSNNLDEFFRVRVATLKRLERLGKKAEKIIGHRPSDILEEIHRIVLSQQADFDNIYQEILQELAREKIFLINENQLEDEQAEFVRQYFRNEVRPALIPIMLDQLDEFPELRDHAIYLVITLMQENQPQTLRYALIELPTEVLPRFVELPPDGINRHIILLDDVIRFCLAEIFSMFEFDTFRAYTIKLTRDAELEFDDDLSVSFMKKVTRGLQQRKSGDPVRFVFDQRMPPELLKIFSRKLFKGRMDGTLIPGGRYHNFKDFIRFPRVGAAALMDKPPKPLRHPELDGDGSLFKVLKSREIMLNYPYQSFDYVIDFLREAAIDPKVTHIRITLYRVARNSNVTNALINAAKNGKSVTVVMELQARFDEENNIYWAHRLQEAGVRVIHANPNYKVHSKLILVSRKHRRKEILYANIGTGNFNESTARLYTDTSIFTTDSRITKEILSVFQMLEVNYQNPKFKHLLVSPINMRSEILRLIDQEISNARSGKEAYIFLKINNLTDKDIIAKLYDAGRAGVEIRLMVRGMFSLVSNAPEASDGIEGRTIIDRYLEHSRIIVFGNGGNPLYYLASADWMPRNLDRRVEVTCPIYNPELQEELRQIMEIQWRDNVKNRVLDRNLINQYREREEGEPRFRAQDEVYRFLRERYFGSKAGAGNPKTTTLKAAEESGAS
nr:polyphosphate kinase 1 [Calditrichia bacterium]